MCSSDLSKDGGQSGEGSPLRHPQFQTSGLLSLLPSLLFPVLLRIFAVHDVHAEPLLTDFGVAAVLKHLCESLVRQFQELFPFLSTEEGIGIHLDIEGILDIHGLELQFRVLLQNMREDKISIRESCYPPQGDILQGKIAYFVNGFLYLVLRVQGSLDRKSVV